MQFLQSGAQERNLQCQTVSKNMLWGWTFKAFKRSENWGYLNKRPSGRQCVKGDMDTPQYVHAAVPSGSFCYWMFYYTHHRNMDAPQYLHIKVTSHYPCPWTFYDTHHTLHHNTCVLYQIPLSTTNAVHYAVNNTSIKCPISCHKTPVQNDVW